MHHDGALAGAVVDALLQPVQRQRIAVLTLVGLAREVESQRTLVGTVFVGERSGVVPAAVPAVGHDGGEKQLAAIQVEHEQALFRRRAREVYQCQHIALATLNLAVSGHGLTEGFPVDHSLQPHGAEQSRTLRVGHCPGRFGPDTTERLAPSEQGTRQKKQPQSKQNAHHKTTNGKKTAQS